MLLLPQTLTMREAPDALRMLAAALQREGGDGELVVDASPLVRYDSAALAVLLEFARLARAWGRSLRVHQPPEKLAELAQLYGVAEIVLGQKAQGIHAPGH